MELSFDDIVLLARRIDDIYRKAILFEKETCRIDETIARLEQKILRGQISPPTAKQTLDRYLELWNTAKENAKYYYRIVGTLETFYRTLSPEERNTLQAAVLRQEQQYKRKHDIRTPALDSRKRNIAHKLFLTGGIDRDILERLLREFPN